MKTNYFTDVEARQGLFSPHPSLLDGFECYGTEESLFECNFTYSPNCTAGQQAGLFCSSELSNRDIPVCVYVCVYLDVYYYLAVALFVSMLNLRCLVWYYLDFNGRFSIRSYGFIYLLLQLLVLLQPPLACFFDDRGI